VSIVLKRKLEGKRELQGPGSRVGVVGMGGIGRRPPLDPHVDGIVHIAEKFVHSTLGASFTPESTSNARPKAPQKNLKVMDRTDRNVYSLCKSMYRGR